ncbi:unnamed protein product [Mycena citricolor]|uniref:Uncharacterized protein n=1 Tax=Mycena citricolor TaxID=2018698 RepID=A0AAD2HFP2_9AGAR|nr:unnamed protein product [Mycena citricolor]
MADAIRVSHGRRPLRRTASPGVTRTSACRIDCRPSLRGSRAEDRSVSRLWVWSRRTPSRSQHEPGVAQVSGQRLAQPRCDRRAIQVADSRAQLASRPIALGLLSPSESAPCR